MSMSLREPRMAGTVRRGRHRFPIRKSDYAAIREFVESTEIDVIGDAMREVVEREMPDLVHKLPKKRG